MATSWKDSCKVMGNIMESRNHHEHIIKCHGNVMETSWNVMSRIMNASWNVNLGHGILFGNIMEIKIMESFIIPILGLSFSLSLVWILRCEALIFFSLCYKKNRLMLMSILCDALTDLCIQPDNGLLCKDFTVLASNVLNA
ncbi:hypothetical protein LWI29_032396 [Acer saccharum]|uniref:Uncharacterized protein n=1 Tax=Acer saccharum TaxID=4024 RepID=A0AA39S1S5_ACESA|nr:hypothetical protein LWI29_032396 [Acer saccharum]